MRKHFFLTGGDGSAEIDSSLQFRQMPFGLHLDDLLLQQGHLLFQGSDLVLDGIGQPVVIQIHIIFIVAWSHLPR